MSKDIEARVRLAFARGLRDPSQIAARLLTSAIQVRAIVDRLLSELPPAGGAVGRGRDEPANENGGGVLVAAVDAGVSSHTLPGSATAADPGAFSQSPRAGETFVAAEGAAAEPKRSSGAQAPSMPAPARWSPSGSLTPAMDRTPPPDGLDHLEGKTVDTVAGACRFAIDNDRGSYVLCGAETIGGRWCGGHAPLMEKFLRKLAP